MRKGQSKSRADRIIDKLKNHPVSAFIFVIGVIIIGIGSVTDSVDKTLHLFTKQPEPSVSAPPPPDSVSINCAPEDIPLHRGQAGMLYAIYLDPKWGNALVSAPSASWPIGATPNDMAYRCEVTNNGKSTLYGLAVVFTVAFRGGSALPPQREINITSPVSIEPQRSVMFYIADDTKQAEEVDPPKSVSARVGDEKERRTIPVRYATNKGQPVKLRDFNPPSSGIPPSSRS